ncbi:hypothetical protein QEN19_002625 [Hanseniaspora menglaensis]
MFSLFSSESKNKKPSDTLTKSKKALLKILNDNFVHILEELYPGNKSVGISDLQIFLQFLLLGIAAFCFYLTKKYDFEEKIKIQWILTFVYFTISILTHIYENYLFYFVNQKSSLIYKNDEENLYFISKLDYSPENKKWPSHYTINNTTKIEFKKIVDKEFKKLKYDALKKTVLATLIEKKNQ